jgi:hypothetical protein
VAGAIYGPLVISGIGGSGGVFAPSLVIGAMGGTTFGNAGGSWHIRTHPSWRGRRENRGRRSPIAPQARSGT